MIDECKFAFISIDNGQHHLAIRIGSFLQKAKNCLTIKGINKLGTSYSYFISLVVSVHFLIDSNETKKFTEGINKLGSWSIYFFGCCVVNYCGGLIR